MSSSSFWRPIFLLSSSSLLFVLTSAEIRGPPRADKPIIQRIGKVGETLRIQCPIDGYPSPMIEWSKDGETIDNFSWDRYKVTKKFLKIRKANVNEDTGIFICKGINGFGSETVRVEVIIIDPREFPSLKDPDGSITAAPPVFIAETKYKSNLRYRKAVGEYFRSSCEALGNPLPRISWFKNGKPLDIKQSRTKVLLEIKHLSEDDSGNYTCRAMNLIGKVQRSFFVEVKPKIIKTTPLTVLTGEGPSNKTVEEGQTATMTCKVKSVTSRPHIKWLKKLDKNKDLMMLDDDTVSVGDERYRILRTEKDIMTAKGEYLNKLVISNAMLSDTGMYICFVTNSGFMPLTYKSAFLKVNPKYIKKTNDDSFPILISMICLTVFVILMVLILITVCVVKKRKVKKSSPSIDDVSSDHESHHPFMAASNYKLPPPSSLGTLPLPPPLTPAPGPSPGSSMPVMPPANWSHTVHPAASSNYQQKYPAPKGFSSRETSLSSYYENPSSKLLLDYNSSRDSVANNQYEVPFSHLMKNNETRPSQPPEISSISYPFSGGNSFQYFHYFSEYDN